MMNHPDALWPAEIGRQLLVENSVFFLISLVFLIWTGWAWREVKPFELPKPLPDWFKYWFGSVQFFGLVPPIVVLGWSLWQGYYTTLVVLLAYFVMLVLQVVAEIVSLRQFRSVVWVMVPYLYVPYRLWQLYEGLTLVQSESDLGWIPILFIGEIFIWGVNYLLDLAQLPKLFRWSGTSGS